MGQSGNHVELSYEAASRVVHEDLPLYPDASNPSFTSFFAMIPIEYIFHDKDLNPRTIIGIDKLIIEFWRKNPQLQVALARIHTNNDSSVPEEERGRLLLFDGQHKTAAQLLLGHKQILVRVFLNPNKDQLKATNARAHRELRQIEFFKSVLDQLGDDIFARHFKAYLEHPDTGVKSERAYIKSIEAERRREELGYLRNHLYTRIANFPGNKFMEFVEKDAPRSKTWPVSYDSLGKTIFRSFVYDEPCDLEIESRDGDEKYVRTLETENVVRLMNILADSILAEGKFDKSKGVFKIEERIKAK